MVWRAASPDMRGNDSVSSRSSIPLVMTAFQSGRDVRFVPIADIPSFDHFVGERPGDERFDAQNKFKLVCLFDSSHLCRSGL